MILLPILALVIGFLLPQLWQFDVPPDASQYIAVAFLAGLDTVCGGVRTGLEGKFRNDVFVTGFISNICIAFFLAWLGDRIGINLNLVAALVLGTRIFTNLSLIRRSLLTKWQDERERERLQRQTRPQVEQ